MSNNKHIEKCKPEEISNAIFDSANDSLVTNALAKEYAEASGVSVSKIEPAESAIDELPSALSVFLYRIFKTPASLFQGKSMSQMFGSVKNAYDWLKERTNGSEHVPAKQLTEPLDAAHLVENLSVIYDRKISNGNNSEIEDGVSLARLLCDNTTQLTEIIDDNVGWVMDRNLRDISVEKIRLNCVAAHNKYIVSNNSTNGGNITSVKTLELPELEEMLYLTTHYNNDYMGIIVGDVPIEHLYLPKFKRCKYHPDSRQRSDYVWVVGGSNYIKEIHAPELTNAISENSANGAISYCSVLRSCIIPKYIGVFDRLFMNCPQLIHVEVCVEQNINLNKWIPTMALRTDTTAEDYVDLREDMSFANNLEQFLYNFQTYIADRAIDRTGQSALTLTLSAEVYASLEQQDGQTILATLTNKNWTVTTA